MNSATTLPPRAECPRVAGSTVEAEPVTADEYRAAIERLGLSQVRAGALLGVDPRTSRRYAAGDFAIPASVELALACAVYLVEEHSMTPDQVGALVARLTTHDA